MGIIAGTMFLRTRVRPDSVINGSMYMSVCFYSVMIMMFNGLTEMTIAVRGRARAAARACRAWVALTVRTAARALLDAGTLLACIVQLTPPVQFADLPSHAPHSDIILSAHHAPAVGSSRMARQLDTEHGHAARDNFHDGGRLQKRQPERAPALKPTLYPAAGRADAQGPRAARRWTACRCSTSSATCACTRPGRTRCRPRSCASFTRPPRPVSGRSSCTGPSALRPSSAGAPARRDLRAAASQAAAAPPASPGSRRRRGRRASCGL
jgi:hypothetical protein